ncbi:phosphoribosylanthranilate isomerase [Salinisphaera sp. USBA-960]|uniref:phosphoribosylanthranilate isomerase n=1 Tax=Salinisphaera orenii TaxID=856731 RepID=UPI000DBE34D0|nr:phosphoribosylanthranilate isomerase [Salifodinibacter halophilus]NNC26104.1 phosphoribosylanthranilate isomerase [Salifodinibacter halophilus]
MTQRYGRSIRRVRTKICGVRTVEDALAAVEAGADAVGLVFYAGSSRAIDVETANQISRALPPFVSRVALFLDADANDVADVVDSVRPNVLQFHGRESPGYCRQFGLDYVKTVPMGDADVDVGDWAESFDDADALLLDANTAGATGGAGTCFDWDFVDGLPDTPLIVAGGLGPDNVAESIRTFDPYAVDVSSGVEDADGNKSPSRMRAFVDAVLATHPTIRQA